MTDLHQVIKSDTRSKFFFELCHTRWGLIGAYCCTIVEISRFLLFSSPISSLSMRFRARDHYTVADIYCGRCNCDNHYDLVGGALSFEPIVPSVTYWPMCVDVCHVFGYESADFWYRSKDFRRSSLLPTDVWHVWLTDIRFVRCTIKVFEVMRN